MRGFKDNLPPISHKFEYIKKIFEEVSSSYAVDLIDLPLVESADLYFRTSGEESDICNKELFEVRKYKGSFENWVLRPEGTASCVRAVKDLNLLQDNKFLRLGYYGPMFRYNRPQKGRYRQFNQAGWEWLGISHKYIDLEIILASCELLDKIGIEYTVELNSIGTLEDREVYRAELREYFNVKEDPFKILDKLEKFEKVPKMQLNFEDQENFEFLLQKLKEKNIKHQHNPYLVRGLDYYNGVVFEYKHEGKTVLGGGRYDGLMSQLSNNKDAKKQAHSPKVPAIGFALGVDRVVDILNYKNVKKTVTVISLNEDAYTYKVVSMLRDFGFSVNPLWGVDLSKGLKAASKTSVYAVIIGENEVKNNSVVLKNLEKASQEEVSIEALRSHIILL
ncbi:histidine--tRNA ligase [Alphaproteobacteria bacterium endosymbiont of Tiliacea citrago]|uniref:histidine--tRNA ligase n=1 Tax=Alphaproteobacteria bacterium endosymbiont of Tiliacea citrago TaxID=3077944 RepID=UPI00313C26FD